MSSYKREEGSLGREEAEKGMRQENERIAGGREGKGGSESLPLFTAAWDGRDGADLVSTGRSVFY